MRNLDGQKKMEKTLRHLAKKKRILFLTTSNRWSGETGGERPKSTALAYRMAEKIGESVQILEIPKLKIYPCEGNISTERGNTCGNCQFPLSESLSIRSRYN